MSGDKLITLADVDGTIPGRAAVLSIDLDAMDAPDGRNLLLKAPERNPLYQGAVEGHGGCTDPLLSVQALWRGIADDWPTHTPAYVSNHRARYLSTQRRLTSMGLDGYTPAEYVARHNRIAQNIAAQPDGTAAHDNSTGAGAPGNARGASQ